MIKEKRLSLTERKNSFKEVNLGLTEKEAFAEANRCLTCKNPRCVVACPTRQKIPEFIKAIKSENLDAALEIILQDNPLPSVCGRVCPANCEKACLQGLRGKPIPIRLLKRFVTERANQSIVKRQSTTKKIAVIGSGPAGLTAAYYLALEGHSIVIFEASQIIGGEVAKSIPIYRLPKKILEKDIDNIKRLGIEIKVNTKIKNLRNLVSQGFDAIFIAVGTEFSQKLNIKGENLNGVIPAMDFLHKVNLGQKIEIGDKVAVVGGGNSAIDSARTALRLGSKVTIVYRRTEKEMPAHRCQINDAKEEGIKFLFLAALKKIIGTEKTEGIECIKMRLGEKDNSGRSRAIPIKGSEFIMKVNNVIPAISQVPNTEWLSGINLSKLGTIVIDSKTSITNIRGVFAGGDVVTGPATIVQAIAAGKKAAKSISNYLKTSEKV